MEVFGRSELLLGVYAPSAAEYEMLQPGQAVAADDALLVMEAMKMEHTIRAPAAGQVEAFYYQPGDLVDGGAELLKFAPEEA